MGPDFPRNVASGVSRRAPCLALFVFWVVTPCSSRARVSKDDIVYFFRLEKLNNRGNTKKETARKLVVCLSLVFHAVLFFPEDRGSIFVRNIGLSADYKTVTAHSRCCENL